VAAAVHPCSTSCRGVDVVWCVIACVLALCCSDDVEVPSSSQHHTGHARRPHPGATNSLEVATSTIPRERMALQGDTHMQACYREAAAYGCLGVAALTSPRRV
jgi:hypothetical protein